MHGAGVCQESGVEISTPWIKPSTFHWQNSTPLNDQMCDIPSIIGVILTLLFKVWRVDLGENSLQGRAGARALKNKPTVSAFSRTEK